MNISSTVRLAAPMCLSAAACMQPTPPSPAAPVSPDTVFVVDTVRVDESSELLRELESQLAGQQIQLFATQQQLANLQEELDLTRQEVVRTMAKLQSQATRAEAASGMAEAEIALEALARTAGGATLQHYTDAVARLEEATAEFNTENYGGAVYLASQARTSALTGQGRLREGQGMPLRDDETVFAVPLPLQTVSRSNVRGGPGLEYEIAFTLDGGVELEGQSRTTEWLRVRDTQRREGWIFYTLVTGR